MNKEYLNKILIKAFELNASDIHLSTDLTPYFRINGDIIPINDFDKLSGNNILDILLSIMEDYIKEKFLKKHQVDFAYYNQENKTRYRVNAYKTLKGISIVFRQLSSNTLKLEDSFPEIFKKIASQEKGLILVCGPTGSGKSTTINSMIDFINRNFKKHIITIEDPVEYTHKTNISLIDQREVGKQVLSFTDGLRSALREDPDIILIGEMRDKETIKMALTAAETGHLVFGTLHTMSASKTIDRIIDSCDLGEKDVIRSMLSTSLQAIILQTLLKNKENTGRIPAFEILIGNSAIRNLIRENKIFQLDSIIQTGSKIGMITMKDYIEKLILEDKVDQNDVKEKFSKLDEKSN